jgi:hypothetical protein
MRSALVAGAGIDSRRFGFQAALKGPTFFDEEEERGGVERGRFGVGAALVTRPQ